MFLRVVACALVASGRCEGGLLLARGSVVGEDAAEDGDGLLCTSCLLAGDSPVFCHPACCRFHCACSSAG